MIKTNLLTIILLTTLLSACGFHTPHKTTNINAYIMSDTNNAFANELKKRFDKNTKQTLIIQIDDEVLKKQASSYSSDGKINSYTIGIEAPVKVFSVDRELLLSQKLTAKMHLNRANSDKSSDTQTDRLQINEGYKQLRNTIVKKLLRKLPKL